MRTNGKRMGCAQCYFLVTIAIQEAIRRVPGRWGDPRNNCARTARLEATGCILLATGRPRRKFLLELHVCNITLGRDPMKRNGLARFVLAGIALLCVIPRFSR